MINEKISGKQIVYIIIPFVLGSSIVTGGGRIPERDSWISMLISIVISIPIVMMYGEVNRLAPKKSLFDLSYIVFGRIAGTIVTFLFSVFSILLGILVIKNFTEYIHVVSLPETPQLLVAIGIGLVMFFTVFEGIEDLGRGCVFVLPLTMFVVVFLILLSIPNMDINNMKPVLYKNIGTVLKGALSAVVFPLAEVVLFTVVFSSVETKTNPAKLYIVGMAIGGLILAALKLSNILVLGYPLIDLLYFPTYERAGIIEAGRFFSRVEILVSGNFIIFGLVKTTICLYVGCKGLEKVFKLKNHKKLAAPVSLVMVLLSVSLFKSTMQIFSGTKLYLIYAPVFEILIPLIIFIYLKVKSRKQRLTGSAEPDKNKTAGFINSKSTG